MAVGHNFILYIKFMHSLCLSLCFILRGIHAWHLSPPCLNGLKIYNLKNLRYLIMLTLSICMPVYYLLMSSVLKSTTWKYLFLVPRSLSAPLQILSNKKVSLQVSILMPIFELASHMPIHTLVFSGLSTWIVSSY